jgi:hypothetical protein
MLKNYINGESYTKIFLALPDLPSKWKWFSAACGVSAALFALGAVALTFIAARGPYEQASHDGGLAKPGVAAAIIEK